MTLARSDLPAHHPQNIPLSQWTDGWLKMEIAAILEDVNFLMRHDHEKAEKGWPVTHDEMVQFIVERGDWLPAAGV